MDVRNVACIVVVASVCIWASTLAWASTAAAQPEPTEVKELILPPRLVRFVEAAYPSQAYADNREASVELELTIGSNGRVTEATVVTSADGEFDEAALAAARQFVFEPARRDWEPVAARIRYRYIFETKVDESLAVSTGRITGKMVTGKADTGVAGAIVEIIASDLDVFRELITDENGTFEVTGLAAATYKVRVLSPEFGQLVQEEVVEEGEVTELTYRLGARDKRKFSGFGTTAIIDPPPREATRRTLRREELTRIAGTRGDALRAVQILPGVARPPLGIGALIVRGSAPGDSETLLEGVPIPLLYHFGGLTSFINSRLLEQVDFFPGNYSSRYGRRTGGILEVSVRDPARDRIHGVVEFGVIDASILLEGPITDKLSIAGGFRRSLIDIVFDKLVPEEVGVTAAPVYYDYQVFLTWRPNKKNRVRLLSYGSSDKFKLFFDEAFGDEPTLRGRARLLTRFFFNHLTWERKISKRVEQEISAMMGPLKFAIGIGNSFDFDGTFYQTYGRNEWRMKLSDKVRLIVGSDLLIIPGKFEFLGPQPRQVEGGGEINEPLAGQDTLFIEQKVRLFRPGFYFETNLDLGPLRLILASRLDYFSEIKRWTADPRLSLIYSVRDNLRLKTAVGLYSQPPEFNESDKDIGNPNLKPIRSVHVGLGAEYDPADGVTIGVEGFYKHIWDRPVDTETGTAPFFENDGIGRIYGAELSVHLKPAGKSYFGYLSYTLSRSERRDHPGDDWRLFDFDQTHIFTAAFTYRFKRGWEVGGTLRIVSGNPDTPVIGSYYDILNDVYFPINGGINSLRSPLFHRLDVRIEKQWIFDKWKFAFFIDVQNAYNKANQEGLVYSFDFRQRSKLKGLPLIPALGLRGEF